jgi:L-lactate dehydrogenase complex protein LldF
VSSSGFGLDTRARSTLPDAAAVARHDAAVFLLREKRDAAVAKVPDFEALRTRAAAIKDHTLDHLDRHLERFEAKARENGVVVHWAADARSLCGVVEALLRERGVRRVVKSKSMLTEECGLNPWLEARGFDVVDTDLGERIVQLEGEPPSHIIVPAIHRTRAEVGALFHRNMGSPAGEDEPERLMAHARVDLRARFLAAEAGITGANFAVAETGSLVIVTNEGNADLGVSLPPLHIACLGIEKLVPSLDDVAVFLRLLARSATGQALSVYTSFLAAPRAGGELHVVLVDNGRSALLASETHRRALRCIRCGACLNTCPVYRRAGGHAYGVPVAGPIGAVLAPALVATREARELPYASSLCGSCTAVCPVRIDLHEQLLAWRREAPALPASLRRGARLAAALLSRPRLYRAVGRVARVLWPLFARRFPGNPASQWLSAREWPEHPGASFAERWRKTRGARP